MKFSLPLLITQCGYAPNAQDLYAPENTLAALHTAADIGAECVAIDVKITKDSIPVLFHDDNLLRSTGLDADISATSFDSLQQLHASVQFGETFAGERIPTLEDALDIITTRGMGACLNLAPAKDQDKDTAEAALDSAARIWPEDAPPPLIISASHTCLETALHMISGWPRALILDDDTPENWAKVVDYLQLEAVCFDTHTLGDTRLDAALSLPIPVLACTINDVVIAKDLRDRGVASIMTSYTDVFRDELITTH